MARWMRSFNAPVASPASASPPGSQLYQVHAVTEGTDAQATVSVRLEEDGRDRHRPIRRTPTRWSPRAKAYVHALNRLLVRRTKSDPDADVKTVSYKDAG